MGIMELICNILVNIQMVIYLFRHAPQPLNHSDTPCAAWRLYRHRPPCGDVQLDLCPVPRLTLSGVGCCRSSEHSGHPPMSVSVCLPVYISSVEILSRFFGCISLRYFQDESQRCLLGPKNTSSHRMTTLLMRLCHSF